MLLQKIKERYKVVQEIFESLSEAPKKYPILVRFQEIQQIVNPLYQMIEKGEVSSDPGKAKEEVHSILDDIISNLEAEKKAVETLENSLVNIFISLRRIHSLTTQVQSIPVSTTLTEEMFKRDLNKKREDEITRCIGSYNEFLVKLTDWSTEDRQKRYPKAHEHIEKLFPLLEPFYGAEMGKFLGKRKDFPLSEKKFYQIKGELEELIRNVISSIALGYKTVYESVSPQILWFMGDIETWSKTDPEERLPEIERRQLEKMLENHDAFIEDTRQKIAKEEARIDFIEAHRDFFQVKERPRSEILGIDLENHIEFLSSLKLGDGVTIGIVDYFPEGDQRFKFVGHAINPEFQGGSGFQGVGVDESPSHGAHVAGIIAGDLWLDQEMKDMTIGVSPHVMFDMIHTTSLAFKDKDSRHIMGETVESQERKAKAVWTVDKMADAITELSQKGNVTALVKDEKIPDIDLSFEGLENNPIITSPAQILNLSLTFGNFGRFSRGSMNHFEGAQYTPVLIKALQTRLAVFITGNDGMDLSTSNQGRLLKALSRSPATSQNLLIATNLMQDGVTLNPSSNTPGDDVYLQRRTLSALGTDVMSSLQIDREEDPIYGPMTGTSMAAPHITGVAAVVLSNYKDLTPSQLSDCLLKGATPILMDKNGVPYELEGVYTANLEAAIEQSDDFDKDVEISERKVNKEDWERGKKSYGMGCVNLNGALHYAEEYGLL